MIKVIVNVCGDGSDVGDEIMEYMGPNPLYESG